MVNDHELLRELNALLKDAREPFLKTDFALIFPIGFIGYSLDNAGRVVGIKIGAGNYDASAVMKKLCQFRNLERLVLAPADPCEIPAEIRNLKNLQFLWLGGGGIKKLPPELLSLNLHVYYGDFGAIGRHPWGGLKGKTISAIVRAEEELSKLSAKTARKMRGMNEVRGIGARDRSDLRADEDQAAAQAEPVLYSLITEEVRRDLHELKGIFLSELNLEDPPVEIAIKGHEAIETYFRERSLGALPLNELKVLLVGNGSAGKTSLVKRMLGESFDAKESQTHGINIRTWVTSTGEGKEVKLNFWDFGGQEIMHATHQFFLSKRSMYILVLDGRKEEDPEYWLQHIESFGGDSPVMVVLNKVDEHPAFEVNRRFLNNKYKGIIGFFRISCATGAGIQNFTDMLTRELDKVSMLQTLWPKDWFRVKQRLENLGSAYISLGEYRAMCNEENVKEVKNQELLVDFLNDLGVVLHFRDMELLDTHVLDPRWVTEAVYRIINSESLAEQKGFLRLNQLSDVLKPRTTGGCVYPAEKYRYIVDLMLKFELCYRLGNDAILVPDLLDIQEPAIVFQYRNELRFVFEYTYMPKSIMPRFIVRMHKDIKDGIRWRTGVLLEEGTFKARALVLADEKAKRIYVNVTGDQKRDYFAVIRKVIHDLNSSFEKLGVTELVPLPDKPDLMIDYWELIGHEVAGRDEIFIGRAGRGYNINALLNGIERWAARQEQQKLVLNVQGDYFENASAQSINRMMAGQNQEIKMGGGMNYKPHSWEKLLVYLTGFLFIGLVSFLAVRNQPIADPNLVVLLRIILSMVVAVFGATIPGMLRVDFSVKGVTIRAIGALALFVITYVLTPKVL